MPPTYDYKCTNCQTEYTYFHVKSDDTNSCPKCASGEAEKLPPKGTSAQFKGSGFHVNDYGKRSRKN